MIELILLLAWIGVLIPIAVLVAIIGIAIYIHGVSEIKNIKED